MCADDDMMCDKVAKSIVSCEGEVIGSCNLEANHFVEEDDTVYCIVTTLGGYGWIIETQLVTI